MAMEARPQTRPGDEGMLPLYNMATGFVHTTIPNFILDYLEANGTGSVLQDWSVWITFLIGFLVCVGIGLLYALVMPVTGCCVCCCRTCCKNFRCCSCCRKKPPVLEEGDEPPKPEPPTKYKQRTCSIFLFVFTSFMFSAVVVSYVALSQMRHELSPFGFLDDLVNGLRDVERYVHDTADQINTLAVTDLEQTASGINDQLDTLVSGAMTSLATAAGTEPAMTQLTTFIDGLPGLNADLIQIQASVATLNTLVGILDGELATSRADIDVLLQNCITTYSLPECQAAATALLDLYPAADYTYVDDVSTAQGNIDAAITLGIIDQVNAEIESFVNLTQTIEQEIGGDVDTIQTQIDTAVNDVTTTVEDKTSVLADFSLENAMATIIDIKNPVHLYGNYAVSGLEFLTTMCLAICTFNYIALVFGLIGSSTTLKHGANLLLAGAGFTFIFGWLAMLISAMTYASGGIAEGVVCRHLLDLDNTADRLTAIGTNFFNIPNLIRDASVEQFMDGCRQNQSIYEVIDPDQNDNIDFNITDILDLSQYGIYETLEDIKATPIVLPYVEIMSDNTAAALMFMYDSLYAINFTTYDIPLAEPNTGIGLPEYSVILLQAADVLKYRDNPAAEALVDESDRLLEIEDTTIAAMDAERAILQAAVNSARDLIEATPMSDIINQLNQSQIIVNDQGADIIGAYINETIDTIIGYLDTYITTAEDQLVNEMGRCRSLYDALTYVVFGPCKYFLNPYQAVWFTYGWFLAFNVLSLAFVFQLAKMFRILAECQKVNPLVTEVKTPPPVGPDSDFIYGYPNIQPPTKSEPLPPKPAPPPLTVSPPPPYNSVLPSEEPAYVGNDPLRNAPKSMEEFYRSEEHPW